MHFEMIDGKRIDLRIRDISIPLIPEHFFTGKLNVENHVTLDLYDFMPSQIQRTDLLWCKSAHSMNKHHLLSSFPNIFDGFGSKVGSISHPYIFEDSPL